MSSTPEPDSRRTFGIIWQNPGTREFVRIGTLSELGDDHYRFAYSDSLPRDFQPLASFPHVDVAYEQRGLFPLFLNRVMSPRRSDYERHLSALGLTRGQAEPLKILARSMGERATDTIHIVQDPVDRDGLQSMLFLVSGVRHVPGADEAITRLEHGDVLDVQPEPQNEADPDALLLVTYHDDPVGYIPRYLLAYIHDHRRAGATIQVVVEQANGPEVGWHLRLLCWLYITVEAALDASLPALTLCADGVVRMADGVAEAPTAYTPDQQGLMRPRKPQPA